MERYVQPQSYENVDFKTKDRASNAQSCSLFRAFPNSGMEGNLTVGRSKNPELRQS